MDGRSHSLLRVTRRVGEGRTDKQLEAGPCVDLAAAPRRNLSASLLLWTARRGACGCLFNLTGAPPPPTTVRMKTFPSNRLSATAKAVTLLCLLALMGLLSSEWGSALILFGLAVLTPALIRIRDAVSVIARAAGDDTPGPV